MKTFENDMKKKGYLFWAAIFSIVVTIQFTLMQMCDI